MSKMEEINAFCEDIQNAEGSKLVEAPKEAQPPEAKKESLLPATLEDMLSAGKDEKAEETTGSSHLNNIINRLKRPEQPNALASKLSNILSKAQASTLTSAQDKSRGPKVWHGVVNVAVVEAWDLTPLKNNNLPDPFIRVKLGLDKFKSKTKSKTLNPKWTEEWDLYLYDDTEPLLEVSIRNTEIGSKEIILGECSINLNEYEEEKTHSLKLFLNKNDNSNNNKNNDNDNNLNLNNNINLNNGSIHLLLTVSYVGNHIEGDTPFTKPKAYMAVERMNFAFLKTMADMERVGWLQINVVKALGVEAVDLRGTSDPYCIVQLVNNRIQTQTIYKTVNPEWNRTFSMNIKDMHSTLTVTVFDENKNRRVEFLGRVAIPLLKIRSGERVWYQLKDCHMACRAKGVILLEMHYVYNPIRAAVRTFYPKEQLYMQQEAKLKISAMKRNVERTRRLVMMVAGVAKMVRSCLSWQSKPKSLLAYVVYCAGVLLLELYMLPLILIIIIIKNLLISNIANCFRDNSDTYFVTGEMDEPEEDLDSKEEKKSLMDKWQGLQEVGLVVQEVLDQVVSSWEKIRNMFLWRTPWLTCLGLMLLILLTIILFLIPTRILLLIWGTRKFSKKLIDPDYEDNNEVLDYLSRLPSDRDLMHHRELQPDQSLMAFIKRDELKLKIN